MLVWILACTGGKDEVEPFDGTFTLTDERNYTFSSTLDIGCQEVALGEDFSIEWAGLTHDMIGQPVDVATDILQVSLVAFDISQEELEEILVVDTPDGEDLVAYASYDNEEAGATSCMASELVIPPAVEFDPAEHFVDDGYSWLVTGGGGVADFKMVTFLCPVAGSSSHDAHLADDNVTLDYTAELEALDAFDIAVPDAWNVEWSQLTHHANGEELDFGDLDQLMIARYDQSIADIEADFIDLETMASEMYTISPTESSDGIYGLTEVDLGEATDADGTAFSGFASGETWLLALRCTECANPAPPFLTVIEVE